MKILSLLGLNSFMLSRCHFIPIVSKFNNNILNNYFTQEIKILAKITNIKLNNGLFYN